MAVSELWTHLGSILVTLAIASLSLKLSIYWLIEVLLQHKLTGEQKMKASAAAWTFGLYLAIVAVFLGNILISLSPKLTYP